MLKNNGGDLISKLGKKTPTEGSGSPEPRQQTKDSAGNNVIGNDLLNKAGEGDSTNSAKGVETNSVEEGEPTSNSTGETAGNDSKSGAEWTTESALKEVKRLRDENKSKRLKYEETVDKMKQEYEARMAAIEETLQGAADAKKELDKIKAEQDDKKRDLAERVAHREARIAELEMQNKLSKQESDKKELEYKTKLSSFEAEKEAEKQIYQQKVEQEIASIPEKYKEFANLIVKGAGDPRDALLELQAAKANKLFSDKTVEVIHAVPGASQGARATKESLDEAAKAAKAKMTSSQKIKEALKSVKSGTPNNAFKI